MIRKISIGPDYKQAMHFTVGQQFRDLTIHTISSEAEGYFIYVQDEEGAVMVWKFISRSYPSIVEYDIEGF